MWGLSNREIATVLWIVGFLAVSFGNADVRRAFYNLLPALFRWKVIGVFVGFAVYVTLWVWLLSEIGIWNPALLKDTIVWWFVSGAVLVVRSLEIAKDPQFVKRTVIELFTANAFLALYFELYSFSLWVELILQPFLVTLALMLFVSRSDPKYAQVLACLNYVTAIVGINLFLLTGWYLIRDHSDLNPTMVALIFCVPVVLTVVSLPYAYGFALIAQYENVFLNMFFRNSWKPVPWSVKYAVILTYKADLHALRTMNARCTAAIARSETYRQARNESRKCRISEASVNSVPLARRP